MNKKRFPDFKGMIEVYHRAGMKVATNIKPCKSQPDNFPFRFESAFAEFIGKMLSTLILLINGY